MLTILSVKLQCLRSQNEQSSLPRGFEIWECGLCGRVGHHPSEIRHCCHLKSRDVGAPTALEKLGRLGSLAVRSRWTVLSNGGKARPGTDLAPVGYSGRPALRREQCDNGRYTPTVAKQWLRKEWPKKLPSQQYNLGSGVSCAVYAEAIWRVVSQNCCFVVVEAWLAVSCCGWDTRTVKVLSGSETFSVGGRYQNTCEDNADSENLMRAIVNCRL
jgi:hypothetical protein